MPPFFDDRFNRSCFAQTIETSVFQFYGKHLKEIREKHLGIRAMDSYGSAKEIWLKAIFNELLRIRHYFEDLQILPKFLNVEREKIVLLYGDAIDDEDYYKFHYDNFVIRLLTSIDLCGKIGRTVFELPIKHGSWYQLMQHPELKGTQPAKILQSFSTYLENYRKHRHQKIHSGQSEDDQFDKIVYWESLVKLTGMEMHLEDMEVLNEFTNVEIKRKVAELEAVINQTIDYTFDFLDAINYRVEKLIACK